MAFRLVRISVTQSIIVQDDATVPNSPHDYVDLLDAGAVRSFFRFLMDDPRDDDHTTVSVEEWGECDIDGKLLSDEDEATYLDHIKSLKPSLKEL